jgi:hypothetical protein
MFERICALFGNAIEERRDSQDRTDRFWISPGDPDQSCRTAFTLLKFDREAVTVGRWKGWGGGMKIITH